MTLYHTLPAVTAPYTGQIRRSTLHLGSVCLHS